MIHKNNNNVRNNIRRNEEKNPDKKKNIMARRRCGVYRTTPQIDQSKSQIQNFEDIFIEMI